jgi:hypothetical protein
LLSNLFAGVALHDVSKISAAKSVVGAERIKGWEKLINTGLRTNINWLENTAKWINDGLELTSSTTKVTIINKGLEVGEISGDLLKVKYNGLGGNVITHPTKTTSVIGKYEPIGGGPGTKNIIESGLTKSAENAGGVNALNDPTNIQGWTPQKVWDDINKPWIEAAVSRGDVLRAVSDPLNINNVFNNTANIPSSAFSSPQSLSDFLKNLPPTQIDQLSYYGREIRHLSQNNYLFELSSNLFLK